MFGYTSDDRVRSITSLARQRLNSIVGSIYLPFITSIDYPNTPFEDIDLRHQTLVLVNQGQDDQLTLPSNK